MGRDRLKGNLLEGRLEGNLLEGNIVACRKVKKMLY